MAGDTDAVLALNDDCIFDISIDVNGQIKTDDFFDTSLLYSILGERRAVEAEVSEPQQRRGWIGNEGKDFENGSKLWLFEQARLTQSKNSIKDEARKSLQWLIDDDHAVSIDEVEVLVKNGATELDITIRRSRSLVVRRFFKLWENTGTRVKTIKQQTPSFITPSFILLEDGQSLLLEDGSNILLETA